MPTFTTLARLAQRTLTVRPTLDPDTAVAVLVSTERGPWDLLTVAEPAGLERATRHVRNIGMSIDLRRAATMLLLEEPVVCPGCGYDDLAVIAATEDREDEADVVECAACRWTAPLTPQGAAELTARDQPAPTDAQTMASALIELWGIEGGECNHGVGFESDCAHHDCQHNGVRPALRLAATLDRA